MRAVVQRVTKASVSVDGEVVGAIGPGLAVLLGVGREDSEADARYLADKIINLRVFPDTAGKMNLSLLESGGALLVVSQFTLYADCRKGRRPGFDLAAPPEKARELYHYFVEYCRNYPVHVACGQFQAEMLVAIYNDGPVTLLLDSQRNF